MSSISKNDVVNTNLDLAMLMSVHSVTYYSDMSGRHVVYQGRADGIDWKVDYNASGVILDLFVDPPFASLDDATAFWTRLMPCLYIRGIDHLFVPVDIDGDFVVLKHSAECLLCGGELD